jgi:hypothetical protein
MKKILILLVIIVISSISNAQTCDSFKLKSIGTTSNITIGVTTAFINLPFYVYSPNWVYLSTIPGYFNNFSCDTSIYVCRSCDTNYIYLQEDSAITAYILKHFYQKPAPKK